MGLIHQYTGKFSQPQYVYMSACIGTFMIVHYLRKGRMQTFLASGLVGGMFGYATKEPVVWHVNRYQKWTYYKKMEESTERSRKMAESGELEKRMEESVKKQLGTDLTPVKDIEINSKS